MEAQQLFRRVACSTMTGPAAARAARISRIRTSTASIGSHLFSSGISNLSCLSLSSSSRPSLTPAASSFSPSSTLPADRRHKATASRTKRALKIAPHPSFVGNKAPGTGSGSSKVAPATVIGTFGSSNSSSTPHAPMATLLYNPPASAPSVYQTPFKFLPASDPRRRSNLMSLFSSSSSSTPQQQPQSPPPVVPIRQTPSEYKYHLSEADIAEMRRLRAFDPISWSVLRLARHFHCSHIFVMMVVRSSMEHRSRIRETVEAARNRWGPIRIKARAERLKRREMLYRGEL